eukprot:gene22248-26833_t
MWKDPSLFTVRAFDVYNFTKVAVDSAACSEAGAAPHAKAAEGRRRSDGTFRERYELGPELGSGATSTVYEAVDCTTKEVVAVKKVQRQEMVGGAEQLQTELQ